MRYFSIALVLVLALIAPLFLYPTFLMQALCFALFASAFNLLFGYTGLISFGHAAFFGFAAYIAGYSAKELGFTPELAILSGGLAAALLGVVIGSLAIRQQGIVFAMITMALAEVVYFVCLRAPFTGGEDGLQSVPRGHLFGMIDLKNSFTMYYFVLALFICCSLLIYRIIHSPFGQVLKAIRENESRAISMGYKTDRYKLVAFVLSATLAGIAGATKALVFQLATLTDVHWHKSGEVVLMTLLGGLGTIVGPWVGATFVVALNDGLAEIGEWVPFILGAIFVVCVLLFRRGIVGELESFFQSRANKTARAAPAPDAEAPLSTATSHSSEPLSSTR
jgi:branched-chain amino acid transport system permease protein